MGWDDFQVTVPVTIHDFPDPNAGGVGIVARWQGHFQIDDEQPGRGWWQIGAYAFYRNRDAQNGGAALSIFTGHYDLERDQSGYEVPLNTPHYFKLRAQTKVPGQSGFYSFKAWEVGTAEPETWTFEIQDAPPDEMFNGSALLVAHEADASFGDVEILPVLDVNVGTVGNGSVQVDPELTGISDAYLYGDVIELAATADPGWIFAGWSGSLSGADNPASLTLVDDAAITATFVPDDSVSLVVGITGSGDVALNPAGGLYAPGTVVILEPQPEPGWQFAGWTGDDAADLVNRGDGTWEITMDAAKSVTAQFGIAHTLLTGLNLLAPRLETDPPTTAEMALDQIEAQGGSVGMSCLWQSMADRWECHAKEQPFNNFVLAPGQGYAFLANTGSTWTRTGTPVDSPVPVQLDPVWTLLGLPNLGGLTTAEDLLNDANAQGGACTEVHRWADGWWDGHAAGTGPGFDLSNDQGYFLKCANTITYTPGGSGLAARAAGWPDPAEPEVLAPAPDPVISDVQVTNHHDVALSITWRTEQPSTGWVEHGDSPALGPTADDDLGEGTVSQVHQVTLTGLTPETSYYFRVHSAMVPASRLRDSPVRTTTMGRCTRSPPKRPACRRFPTWPTVGWRRLTVSQPRARWCGSGWWVRSLSCLS